MKSPPTTRLTVRERRERERAARRAGINYECEQRKGRRAVVAAALAAGASWRA